MEFRGWGERILPEDSSLMKVEYMGKLEDAVDVEVVTCDEPWTKCQLSDGRILMFKNVVVSVCKLAKIKNQDGSPIYQFKTQKVVKML